MQIATDSALFLQMYLRYLANTQTPGGPPDDAFHELVRLQSALLPGYNLAIASSIRDGPIRSQAPVFAALGRLLKKRNGKALLIWVRAFSLYTLCGSNRVCLVSDWCTCTGHE